MSGLLLSPHHDDETLFAAFTLLGARPRVAVVLGDAHLQHHRGNTFDLGGSHRHPITSGVRELETRAACAILGVTAVEFWPFPDDEPDWAAVRARLTDDPALANAPCVWAPAWHPGGHPHHNALAEVVVDVLGPRHPRLELYHTYVDGRHRVPSAREVSPEPGWVGTKLRALACYESQAQLWPHHFLDGQREYLAERP